MATEVIHDANSSCCATGHETGAINKVASALRLMDLADELRVHESLWLQRGCAPERIEVMAAVPGANPDLCLLVCKSVPINEALIETYSLATLYLSKDSMGWTPRHGNACPLGWECELNGPDGRTYGVLASKADTYLDWQRLIARLEAMGLAQSAICLSTMRRVDADALDSLDDAQLDSMTSFLEASIVGAEDLKHAEAAIDDMVVEAACRLLTQAMPKPRPAFQRGMSSGVIDNFMGDFSERCATRLIATRLAELGAYRTSRRMGEIISAVPLQSGAQAPRRRLRQV